MFCTFSKAKVLIINTRSKKLSYISLITGIIAFILLFTYIILALSDIIRIPLEYLSVFLISLYISISVILLLAISSIVCGCIDFKKSLSKNMKKNRVFDIAGIIFGSIVILTALFLVFNGFYRNI